jgi:hypothetical protein
MSETIDDEGTQNTNCSPHKDYQIKIFQQNSFNSALSKQDMNILYSRSSNEYNSNIDKLLEMNAISTQKY